MTRYGQRSLGPDLLPGQSGSKANTGASKWQKEPLAWARPSPESEQVQRRGPQSGGTPRTRRIRLASLLARPPVLGSSMWKVLVRRL